MTKTHSMSDEMIAAELAAVEPRNDEDNDEDFDEPLPTHVRVTRGHSRSRTLQVRLNDDELDRLNRAADETGVPASTYARMLLLDSMDNRPQSALATLDPSSPRNIRRIRRALGSRMFNVIVAAALAAEETEESRSIPRRRATKATPAKKTVTKKAAAKKTAVAAPRIAAGAKIPGKIATKTPKSPTRQRFTEAAKRSK